MYSIDNEVRLAALGKNSLEKFEKVNCAFSKQYIIPKNLDSDKLLRNFELLLAQIDSKF